MLGKITYFILLILTFIFPEWAFPSFFIFSSINILYSILTYFNFRNQFAKLDIVLRKSDKDLGLRFAPYFFDSYVSSSYGRTLFIAQILNLILGGYYWYQNGFNIYVVISIVNIIISHIMKVIYNPMPFVRGKREEEIINKINDRLHNKQQ